MSNTCLCSVSPKGNNYTSIILKHVQKFGHTQPCEDLILLYMLYFLITLENSNVGQLCNFYIPRGAESVTFAVNAPPEKKMKEV